MLRFKVVRSAAIHNLNTNLQESSLCHCPRATVSKALTSMMIGAHTVLLSRSLSITPRSRLVSREICLNLSISKFGSLLFGISAIYVDVQTNGNRAVAAREENKYQVRIQKGYQWKIVRNYPREDKLSIRLALPSVLTMSRRDTGKEKGSRMLLLKYPVWINRDALLCPPEEKTASHMLRELECIR